MVKSKFTPAEKSRIVLEFLNTNISTAELCRKHNIAPQTFYQKKYQTTYRTFQLITRNVGGLKRVMHVLVDSDQKLQAQTNP